MPRALPSGLPDGVFHVTARVSAWVVDGEQRLAEAYAYIEENPAKAGLCEPGDVWPRT
jgi:hypothetical protein